MYMDDMIYNQGYRNGIWHRKMCYAKNEMRKKRNNRRNRITKLKKNQNARKKGKLQIFGNIGNAYQTS